MRKSVWDLGVFRMGKNELCSETERKELLKERLRT